MKSTSVKNFNLKETIESGQVFRFVKEKSTYYLGVGSSIIKLSQVGNTLYYDSSNNLSLSAIKRILALDEDYD